MEQPGAQAGFTCHYNTKDVGKEVYFLVIELSLGTWQNKAFGKGNAIYEALPKSWAQFQAFSILYL